MNNTYFKEKVHMLNIFLKGLFDEGWCENYGGQWNPQSFNSFRWGDKLGWGVEVWWQIKRWPCNAFLRLNGKTYHMKIDLEMFTGRWYNKNVTYDVNVIWNGWK